ncbi:MFS transporter [Bombella sp. TMW 2.2543]|uniref:MFS transporter n=1 Tax=Bombella pluederhausensis TaxID=2967336 RepID=A0ABT3WEJ3_9PROT|nr:MFS transporter [Bombella pluederhausensis]MCX5617499.1 MFS transporter [Bombella pluederhausensis]
MFRTSRYRLAILFLGQLLFTAAFSIDLTLTGVVGYQLTPDKTFATLPYSLITLVACLTTFFASILMGRLGRRAGFILGALAGAIGGLTSFQALATHSFPLFCCGTAAVGVFQAFAQYYRLAAADDTTTDTARARSIATVLSGGVIASLLGPFLAYLGDDLIPGLPHSGAYLIVAALALLSVVLMFGLKDRPRQVHLQGRRKISLHFLRQIPPRERRSYLLAIATNALSYSVMMVLMSITPIHILQQGHDVDFVSEMMMAHLFAMFSSSPLSGWLYNRAGSSIAIMVGLVLILGVALLNVMFNNAYELFFSLFLLGLAWNILFVSGSTLLVAAIPHTEYRPGAQGLSEFVTALCTAIGCFAGGVTLKGVGWEWINYAAVGMVVLFMVALFQAIFRHSPDREDA